MITSKRSTSENIQWMLTYIKKVSHQCMIYSTEYTINYIYMQWLDYHAHSKKIQYFYVHFLNLHFHIQYIKLKRFSVQNLMCTEFVNPYSYGCTSTHMLKTRILQTLNFFFFFLLHVQSWHPYTNIIIFKMWITKKINIIMQTFLI